MIVPEKIILKPVLTEKSSVLSETGGLGELDLIKRQGDEQGIAAKYTFEVHPEANKVQIKQAIEKLFQVQVTKVHTIRGRRDRRVMRTKRGILKGQRPLKKKAVVTLSPGDTIELFEGV